MWVCFDSVFHFFFILIVVVLRVDIWISVLVLVKVKTIACLTVRGKIGWVWYVCGWMCLFRQQRRGRKSETPLETVRDWVVCLLLLLKRSSVAQNNRHRKGRKNRGELQCCRVLRCAVLEELEVSHYCFCDSAGAVSELSRCAVDKGC